MTNYFTVNIFTPSSIVAKDLPASSLLVPSSLGQINVLPNHTHLVTSLGTGELSVFGGANDPDRHFAVSHGICKVLHDKVVILATTSEEMYEIDKNRAKLALKNAQEILSSGKGLSDDQVEKYRRKVERAKLRIQLSEYSNKK